MRRIYRMLLKLYPARFREEYSASMERQFSDEYRETQGRGARIRLGLQALADLAASAPMEIARELRQDFRYAIRVYRRRSLMTFLALAALALAIGATTGIFGVLNAVLIRSLPFRQPEQLVELWLSPMNVAYGRPAFQSWRDNNPYLADAAGYAANEMNLGLARESVRVHVAETTSNFLRMMGSEPEFGRGFTVDEETPGRASVAVIGYGLWQQYFGGDPRVLGSVIRLNGVPLTIIGVAPSGFDYPDQTSVWTPTIYDLQRIPKPGAYRWQTIGRLRPDVSFAQASRMFEAEIRRTRNGGRRGGGEFNTPHLYLLRDRLAGPVGSASMVLMGLVVFVLLIACANLAHLLLSRSTERRHELAVRAALGASRGRLVQQLITEATILTATAALGGMAVAHWTAQIAAAAQPAQLAARQYSVLDWRVIVFTAGLALLAGLVFGVLPASLIGRMQPGQEVLRRQPGLTASSTGHLRSMLIGVQAALTVTLIAGSLSMGRSFLKLLGTDLAFRTDRVVTLNVSLAGTRYESDNRERQYYSAALEELRAMPGVQSAAAVSFLPLLPKIFIGGSFKLDSGEQGPMAVLISASPGYFHTMGTALLEGREFNESDRHGGEPVVIISDELAQSFGRGSLLGRKMDIATRGEPQMATIVGVVRAQHYNGPFYKGGAQVFRPIEQWAPGFVSFVASVQGHPEDYLASCRDAVQRTDRDVPVYDVKSLDRRLAETLARPRFYTTAILFLTGFALLLVVVGTYGVATYTVGERTHEIGVRIAVGASYAGLRGMLFRQTMLPVCAGTLAGVLVAVSLGRFLQHLIESAEPAGIWGSAAAVVLLSTATALAVWSATDRIVRMDPTAALRVD